jgi:hypothetical protein
MRYLPGALTRYRDSWRDAAVARQMIELTEAQLQDPDAVAPYRAFRALLARLLEEGDLPRPAKLLDIGAGAGAYGELLDRWAPGRFEYTGADYSEEILAAARSRWPDRFFVQRDVLTPSALDGHDVVLASAVLDVLAEPEEALAALLGSDARWVVLHRQRIDSNRTHVEVVPGYRGQRTYRSYLTLEDIRHAADRHGRAIEADIEVEADIRSFLLKRA